MLTSGHGLASTTLRSMLQCHAMRRRTFLQLGLGAALANPLIAAVIRQNFDAAADLLSNATETGQIHAASLYVRHGKTAFTRTFGAASSPDAIFLLASISKPISAAALMSLYDRGEFRLEDPVSKFIPEFTNGDRNKITIRQLLTHTSGLPDQLPENRALRSRHAKLSEFVAKTIDTPLLFAPDSRYSYSSMGILLAAEIAQRIGQVDFLTFVDQPSFNR